jgi:hypothetical protein
MLTLPVARSETIAHKSAVSLQSRRVSSGPGSGQDVLKRTAFAWLLKRFHALNDVGRWVGPAPHAKNFGGALDHCNRSKRAALLVPAATTAFSKLLGLSPTIRSLRKHT